MDSNLWFYVLSVVPQTLGAMIALSATFIIFKLNHVEERTKIEYDEIKDWILPLLPELKIFEITKLDDRAMLSKLIDAINKLDPQKSRFGLDEVRFHQLYEIYEYVLRSHKRKIDSYENIYPYLEEKRRVLTSLIEVRRNALTYLWISLALSVVTIASSIILLPLYGVFGTYASEIIGAVMILAVFSVLFTAYSIWDIARRDLR